MILQNRVALQPRSQLQSQLQESQRQPQSEPQTYLQSQRLPEFTEVQDDSWLNDRGNGMQPEMQSQTQLRPPAQPRVEDDVTIRLPKPGKLAAQASNPVRIRAKEPVGREAAPMSAPVAHKPLSEYITVGHPLWPLVLQLSERIWHELYQKPDIASVSDFVLIEFVRKRAIDMLRTEPRIAGQVHDLDHAELVLHSVVNETLGYGPLEPLLRDESVYEITAVGPRFTYIDRNGSIEDVPCVFEDDRHMLRIVENMLRRSGRRSRPNWPLIDARLPDGSLVNIVLPPSAINGPTITVRKRSKKPRTLEDLIQLGALTPAMADYLCACVRNRRTITICGGIASGRTTLLNALCAFIPGGERITTIEEMAELQLSQKHVISLVAQLNGEAGGVTMHDLVLNALRTGSERIILGECRGSEVSAIMQAIASGYNGVLLNLFANSLDECLTNLETLCLDAAPHPSHTAHLLADAIRRQLAASLDIIVQVGRLRDGSRKVLNIAEVQCFDGNDLKLHSVYHYKESGSDHGEFVAGG
jgi:pilus assembly protein CpaF